MSGKLTPHSHSAPSMTKEAGKEAGGYWSSRRHFLVMGLGLLLAGCASTSQQRVARMPGPVWVPRQPSPRPVSPPPSVPVPPVREPVVVPSLAGVLPRSRWAAGQPVTSRMTRMTAIGSITVHHDGMSVFRATDERSTVHRLESIRIAHRVQRGWGDIGYHYVIDRSGRVWEGRPIGWQGAHVANHNEGNIGVLLLGNFDQQSPSAQQLEALNGHLTALMRIHRVPLANVATHREWETAATVCPGATLQAHMDSVRSRRMIG